MRPLRVLAFVLLPVAALAATREILLAPTPTRIPRTGASTGVVIYNAGPEPICCAQAADGGVPPDCIPLVPGSALSLDIPSNQPVSCTAPTLQVADAGTRFLEVY